MMDFWHCHKPHEKDLKANGSRYATFGSGFIVESGTGLVDGVGFLSLKESFGDAVKVCWPPGTTAAIRIDCISPHLPLYMFLPVR